MYGRRRCTLSNSCASDLLQNLSLSPPFALVGNYEHAEEIESNNYIPPPSSRAFECMLLISAFGSGLS